MAREVIVTNSGDTRDIFGAPDPHMFDTREPGTPGPNSVTGRCSCGWAQSLIVPTPAYPTPAPARAELARRHVNHAADEVAQRAEQDNARSGPFSMDPQLDARRMHRHGVDAGLAVREPSAGAPGIDVTLADERGPIAIFPKGYPSRRGVNPIRLTNKTEESVP